MADDVSRELGRLEARLDAQGGQITELRADVKQLLEYAARTKGGWWALASVGGIGGAIGAGAVKLFAMLKGGG